MNWKSKIGALFVAMIILSVFTPSVMAQSEKTKFDKNEIIVDSNGQITTKGAVGILGENIADTLYATLWVLETYIDDDRIDTAQSKLSKAAQKFRENDIENGMNYLTHALNLIWDILSDWASQIPSWLYNELVDLLEEAQDFIDQYT